MQKIRSLIVWLVVSTGAVGGAFAQSHGFDVARLLTGCGSGNCENSLVAIIRDLQRQDLSSDDFNSRLGVLAAILFEAARGADAATTRRISIALQYIAQFSTDTAQSDAFIWVANAIASGQASLFSLDDPFAVSPS